jgi:hypothetical protein
MKLMADANADTRQSMLSTARSFPAAVPILIDAEAGIALRATSSGDLAAMVEQCRDPDMIRWTTVPTPPGGYQLRDAEDFWPWSPPAGTVVNGSAGPSRGSEVSCAVFAAASTFACKATGLPRSVSGCILMRAAARS